MSCWPNSQMFSWNSPMQGSHRIQHTFAAPNPPSTARTNLSDRIAELDRSAAMCSCACNIIPDCHSVRRLCVVASNGTDVKLCPHNLIPSSLCALAVIHRDAPQRPPSPALAEVLAKHEAEESFPFSLSWPLLNWHNLRLPLMSIVGRKMKSVDANEFRLKSSSIYNHVQTLTEVLAPCVMFYCVRIDMLKTQLYILGGNRENLWRCNAAFQHIC